MKSPFRSIRQTLFNEGKLLRYLGYAVGEIALIIIGIMMALQLNNWNEDRKAQVEFELYLVQLREDVQKAILDLERRLANAEETIEARLTVLRILDNKEAPLENIQGFEAALTRLRRSSVYDVHIGFLGDLLNGKLEAITQDRSLVRQVMELTSLIKIHLDVIEQHQKRMEFADETFMKSVGITHASIPELKMRYDLERLRTSPDFLITVQNTISSTRIKHTQEERIKNRLEAFLSVLEEYE